MTTTRRSFVAGTAALPALSIAPGALAGGDHPDAELFRLYEQARAVYARQQEAEKRHDRLWDEATADLPPRPPHPSDIALPAKPAGLANVSMVDFAAGTNLPPAVMEWCQNCREIEREARAAFDDWDRRHDAARAANGCDALGFEIDAICDEKYEVIDRLLAIRAQTVEGMAVKLLAKALDGWDIDELDDMEGGDALASIAADICELAQHPVCRPAAPLSNRINAET